MGISNFGDVRTDKLRLRAGSTDPTAVGEITYVTGTGFRAWGNGGLFTIPTSGGGGSGAGDLDSALTL